MTLNQISHVSKVLSKFSIIDVKSMNIPLVAHFE